MQTSDVKKLKTLEEENLMLKRILGQKELEITAIKAVLEKSGDRRPKTRGLQHNANIGIKPEKSL